MDYVDALCANDNDNVLLLTPVNMGLDEANVLYFLSDYSNNFVEILHYQNT